MTGQECNEKKCFVEAVIDSLAGIGLNVKKLSSKDVFLDVQRIKKESLGEKGIFYQKIKEFFEDIIIIDGIIDPAAYEKAKSLLPNRFILIHCLCFEQKSIERIEEEGDDYFIEIAKKAILDKEDADRCWNYFLSEATLWLATASDIPKIIELIMPSLIRYFRGK